MTLCRDENFAIVAEDVAAIPVPSEGVAMAAHHNDPVLWGQGDPPPDQRTINEPDHTAQYETSVYSASLALPSP